MTKPNKFLRYWSSNFLGEPLVLLPFFTLWSMLMPAWLTMKKWKWMSVGLSSMGCTIIFRQAKYIIQDIVRDVYVAYVHITRNKYNEWWKCNIRITCSKQN